MDKIIKGGAIFNSRAPYFPVFGRRRGACPRRPSRLTGRAWGGVFSWPATVLAAVVISFPLMYRSARGAFEQVDETLIYAARTIGLSEWRIFWRIIMPLALPGVASGGILAFARGLGEFGATAMIAGNIAGKTRTLPLAIYSAVAAGTWTALMTMCSF